MPALDLSALFVLNKEDLRQLLRDAATENSSFTLAELTKQTGLQSYKLRLRLTIASGGVNIIVCQY